MNKQDLWRWFKKGLLFTILMFFINIGVMWMANTIGLSIWIMLLTAIVLTILNGWLIEYVERKIR